jgi:hypothetical protein
MAFLDNSGDIILDAVLTDSGRFRLAKGDGSFKIVKFALGDDEINYQLYDKNDSRGSPFYDLEILQTPVLESFTNDDSSMKSKLISIPRTNLLYLPVIIPNEKEPIYTRHSSGTWVVAVDQNTVGTISSAGLIISTGNTDSSVTTGILNGFNPGGNGNAMIRVDQGLNTTEIPSTFTLDADLVETQYMVEMDNRFGSIVDSQGNATTKSFVDDDNIATYYFAKDDGNGNSMIVDIGQNETTDSSIQGPRGTFFNFKLQASTDLRTSNYLFDELGTTGLSVAGASTVTCRFIDTTVRVMGATTGYRVDVPVRFVKKQ